MPHRLPAAILIQTDRSHPAKQEAICLEYAEAHGLRAVALCHIPRDCAALVAVRKVRVVITVTDPGDLIREEIERAGGVLHVARADRVRVRRDVNNLVVRMYNRGMDTQEIAQILEVDSKDVRRSLARARVRQRGPSE